MPSDNVSQFYVEYRLSDGAIVSSCESNHEPLARDEFHEILQVPSSVDINCCCVDLVTLTTVQRQEFDLSSASLVNELYTLDVPVGTTIIWQNELYEINDGSISLTVDQVGTFPLQLYHPLMLDKVVNVVNP